MMGRSLRLLRAVLATLNSRIRCDVRVDMVWVDDMLGMLIGGPKLLSLLTWMRRLGYALRRACFTRQSYSRHFSEALRY